VEVGYGLEGVITDAVSARVIRNVLAPAFRKGDYGAGIERALDALMALASDGKFAPSDAPSERPERKRAPGGLLGAILTLLAFGPFLAALVFVLFLVNRSGRRGG